MDVEICISCNFHVSRNTLLSIFFQQLSPCGSNKRGRLGQQPITWRPPDTEGWKVDIVAVMATHARYRVQGKARQQCCREPRSEGSRTSSISIAWVPPQTYRIHICRSVRSPGSLQAWRLYWSLRRLGSVISRLGSGIKGLVQIFVSLISYTAADKLLLICLFPRLKSEDDDPWRTLRSAWQVMLINCLLWLSFKISKAHAHTPKGHFPKDRHIFSRSLELNSWDCSSPNTPHWSHPLKKTKTPQLLAAECQIYWWL